MKNKFKKMISIMVSFAILFSVNTVNVFATDVTGIYCTECGEFAEYSAGFHVICEKCDNRVLYSTIDDTDFVTGMYCTDCGKFIDYSIAERNGTSYDCYHCAEGNTGGQISDTQTITWNDDIISATLSGTAMFGETLTLNAEVIDKYTEAASSLILFYTWKAGGSEIASREKDNNSYTLTANEIGKLIIVEISLADSSVIGTFYSGTAVAKAPAIGIVTPPTVESKTDNSITVATVSTQEYSIDGGTTWQDSGVFSNLDTNTTYSISTRIKETSSRYASDSSNISIRTNLKTPTASASDISKVYNGTALTSSDIIGTASYDGEDIEGTFSFKDSTEIKNVSDSGTKEVIFTPTDTTNYSSVTTDISVTISKAEVTATVTTDDLTVNTGEDEPTFTVSQSDFFNDEVISNLTFTASPTLDMDTLGTYTITPSGGTITGGDINNYNITYNSGTLTVKGYQTLSFENDSLEKELSTTRFTNTLSGAQTDVTYTSSNIDVATVSSTGVVTLLSSGTATITATAEDTDLYHTATNSYDLIVNAGSVDVSNNAISSFDATFCELEAVKITVDGTTTTLTMVADKYLTGYDGYDGYVGEVNEGSIEVTLYKEFLATLPIGEYTTEVTTKGGVSVGTLTATISAVSTTPDTSTTTSSTTSSTTSNTTSNTTSTVSVTAWYAVTLSTSGGGTLAPELSDFETVTMQEGTSYTFIITPYTGYAISAVYVDGTNIGAVSEYTIDSINSNRSIHVDFASTSADASVDDAADEAEAEVENVEEDAPTTEADDTADSAATEDAGADDADVTADEEKATEAAASGSDSGSVVPIVGGVVAAIAALGGIGYFLFKRKFTFGGED